jgi:hypothetical protein
MNFEDAFSIKKARSYLSERAHYLTPLLQHYRFSHVKIKNLELKDIFVFSL